MPIKMRMKRKDCHRIETRKLFEVLEFWRKFSEVRGVSGSFQSPAKDRYLSRDSHCDEDQH
jgi:hypothetical protein